MVPWVTRDATATPDEAICAVADIALDEDSLLESLNKEVVGAVSSSGSG